MFVWLLLFSLNCDLLSCYATASEPPQASVAVPTSTQSQVSEALGLLNSICKTFMKKEDFKTFKEKEIGEKIISFKDVMNDLKPSEVNEERRGELVKLLDVLRDEIIENIFSCKETVERVLSLSRIDVWVQSRMGWQGRSVMTNIPVEFRPAVQALVGRIFAVDPESNQVVHTGSGMILPQDESHPHFSRIVTCSHVMKAQAKGIPDEDAVNFEKFRHYKFYFVRSVALSPDTPSGITVSATSARLKIPHVAGTYYDPGQHTLETGCVHPDAMMCFESDDIVKKRVAEHDGDESEKYKKIFYRYLQHKSREEGSNLVREIVAPCDVYDQDGVEVCSLKKPFDAFYLSGICQNISVRKSKPISGQKTYSIGFPESPYIMNDIENMENWCLCLVQGRAAPLTMTMGFWDKYCTPTADPRYLGGFFHNAPTAEGMSGGPILVFDEAEGIIKLIGVVGVGSLLTQQYIMFTFF